MNLTKVNKYFTIFPVFRLQNKQECSTILILNANVTHGMCLVSRSAFNLNRCHTKKLQEWRVVQGYMYTTEPLLTVISNSLILYLKYIN